MTTMHSDLFQALDTDGTSPLVYAHAFESWLREKQAASRLRQDSSSATYASMWKAFSDWAVARSLVLQDLNVADLEAYIASRGQAEDLSPRYVWRLLRLLDAVLRRHCRLAEHPVNDAAHTLLMQRPEWRYAQASHNEELPSYLAPARAPARGLAH